MDSLVNPRSMQKLDAHPFHTSDFRKALLDVQ